MFLYILCTVFFGGVSKTNRKCRSQKIVDRKRQALFLLAFTLLVFCCLVFFLLIFCKLRKVKQLTKFNTILYGRLLLFVSCFPPPKICGLCSKSDSELSVRIPIPLRFAPCEISEWVFSIREALKYLSVALSVIQ